MTDRTELWGKLQTAQGAIVQYLGPKLQPALQESMFHEVPGWFHIGFAYYIRPDAMTVERVRIRNPYSTEAQLAANIQGLKDAEFLDDNGVITDEAFNAYQGLIDFQDGIASEADLVSDDVLSPIAEALSKTLDNALKLNAPCLQDVSRYELPSNLVHRIYYQVYRLGAWRDDAHLQIWQATGIDGHTHEAASLVWDGTATNPAKFMEVRGGRGYDETGWQAKLDTLVDKGWLIKTGDDYAVSDTYKAMREEIETKTNDLFYQAFADLSDADVEHLLTLLQEVEVKFTPEPQAS